MIRKDDSDAANTATARMMAPGKTACVLALLSALTIADADARQNLPCEVTDDELFVSIDWSESTDVSLDVYHVVGDSLFGSYELPHESGRGSCDWIAFSENGGGTDSTIVELQQNTLYKLDIPEDDVVQTSFLYVGCVSPVSTDVGFYCGLDAMSGTTNNDVFIEYAAGDIGIRVDGFYHTEDLVAHFSDSNWLLPHDTYHFCADNNKDMKQCLYDKHLGFFLANQSNPDTLTHTADDLVVAAGSTWEQDWELNGNLPGSTDLMLEMTSGTKIKIEGSAEFYNMELDGASSTWSGVKVEEDATALFDDVTFDGINPGAGGAAITATSSTGNSTYLEIRESTLTVDDGYVVDAISISGTDAEAWIFDNHIKATYGNAIRIQGYGDAYVRNNDIEVTHSSTAYSGIQASGGASVYTGLPSPVYDWDGVNEFMTGSKGFALYASGTGTTIEAGSGSSGYWDDNHFCGSASTLVKAVSPADIDAIGNNWPSGSATGKYSTSSTVDVESSGWGTASCSSASLRLSGFGTQLESATARYAGYTASALTSGYSALGARDFGAAAQFFQAVLDTTDNSVDIIRALSGLAKSIARSDVETAIPILERFQHQDPEVESARLLALMRAHAGLGDRETAVSYADRLIRDYGEMEASFQARLFLASEAAVDGEYAVASSWLDRAEAEAFAHDQRTDIEFLRWHFAGSVGTHPGMQARIGSAQSGVLPHGAGGVALVELAAYPNPFNPRSTVELRLLENSLTEVSIFDVLGRRIALLFRGQLDAGVHSISWDATGYPAGTYFAVVRAGISVTSIPIVLQK